MPNYVINSKKDLKSAINMLIEKVRSTYFKAGFYYHSDKMRLRKIAKQWDGTGEAPEMIKNQADSWGVTEEKAKKRLEKYDSHDTEVEDATMKLRMDAMKEIRLLESPTRAQLKRLYHKYETLIMDHHADV